MPEVVENNYKCYPESSDKIVRMISGNLKTERGHSHVVLEYTLGKNQFLPNETQRTLMAILKSGKSIEVFFASPNSDTLELGMFKCITVPRPSAAHVSGGKIYWNLTTMKLEGVNSSA